MSQDNKDFVPYSLPSLGKEEEDAVLKVMRSGWITTGKMALEFENAFAEKIGASYCLAVNSATSGLLLAMEACGIGPGNKILTTPYTFISTATSAVHLGADIVYADIEKDSYNIDPKEIETIVPVHIAGNVCKMKEIIRIAHKYDVFVIEDCAHAFPSKTENGYAGTLGDIGVFSFYATKTMTTAEGGMISTNDEELAKRMRIMRMHGIDRNVWDRYTSKKASWEYDVVDAGYKCNLPDILATIGIEQLKKADLFFDKRKKIVETYNKEFSKYNFIILPPDSIGNSWHLYLLGLDLSKLKITRNEFSQLLQDNGIGISMHFIPHYRFSIWNSRPEFCKENYPNAEEHFQRTISLPLWPDMTQEMINKVITTVIKIGKENEKCSV